MAKVTKAIGTIAGIVAMVPGPWQPIAAVVATVANVATAVLQKKPPARGSVNNILISPEAPSPYLIGRTYAGGVLRYDKAWGGKVGKVQNPYRAMVSVYSVAGPVDALEGIYADFSSIPTSSGAATGYYSTFLWIDSQTGARPESNQLQAQWAGMPNWSASSKLSSKAAILWSLKFDKDGKRFAAGVPQLGAVWRGVKVYDPRLDSTYPGGSGSQRITDESTWTYSDTPALHALAYVYGRYVQGKKVMGIGMPVDGIDIASFVAGANVEEANDWHVGGVIYEPGDRWQNLKDICAAGSAEPVFSGGRISYKQDAPRVSLATVGNDDLADDPVKVRAMQTWRDRLNTIVPKYRSEAHKWEYVTADEVSVGSYVTEDGERKVEEIQWNLVQNVDHVTQLAAYRLVNGRELVIDCTLKPEFRFYQPGDMLTFELADAGLDGVDAVMVSRTIDPATLSVAATFIGETAAKHDYALGLTGTAPPTPSLLAPEDRDEASVTNNRAARVYNEPIAPGDANEGDIWFDTDDNYKQYVFTGGVWVPSFADSSQSTQAITITSRSATTSAITLSLADGSSRQVEASIKVDGLAGSGSQSIKIEWREAGGTYATLGSTVTDSGGTGDTVYPISSETLTNSTGVTKIYEIRAVTSFTGAAGTVDQSQSYLRA